MCHIWSRKAKIQPQMAVSGNADIFSIKVDSRLKTILIHTGVTSETNFSSVFLQKYICSPKCRFRECSWREIGKMPEFFTGNSVLGPKGHIQIFNFRGVGGPPLRWKLVKLAGYLKFLQETQLVYMTREWICFKSWHTRGPQIKPKLSFNFRGVGGPRSFTRLRS